MRKIVSPRGVIANRIDRYILRQLVLALLAVTCGLVALIWLTQSLRFVELVVNRGLSLRVFLQLTSLLIPSFVAVILPITTFVVVQFIYQGLAGDRELTVMRAAGLSPAALARPALVLATMSVVCCYLLNVWVVPSAFGAFREFNFEIRNKVAAFLLQEGVFTPVSDDLTVYVRAREQDGTLRGILVDDGRNAAAHSTVLAERGRLIPDGDTPRVLLSNGSREEIDSRTGQLHIGTFSEYTVELTPSGKGEVQRYRDATEMSIAELLHPPDGIQERDWGKLRAEAHRRLAAPLSTVSFTMVALVSVLMGMFRRHSGMLRPFLSIMTVVALVASGLAINNLAARQPVLLPLIWLHATLPGLLCGWVLFGPQLRLVPVGLQARLGVT